MLVYFATLVARGAAALGGFLLSLVVARQAGAEGLGMLTVFISLLGALSIFGRRGQDSLLMRSVATRRSPKGFGVILLRFSMGRVWHTVLIATCLGFGLLTFGAFEISLPYGAFLFPPALILLTILALISGYMRGMERPFLAPAMEIGGVSLITSGLLFVFFGAARSADPLPFLAPLLLTSLMSLLVGAMIIVYKDNPDIVKLSQKVPITDTKELTNGEWDFTLIAFSGFLFQAGSFLLASPFLDSVEIGLLRAAERFALLISFPLLVVTPIVAPKIAQAARAADTSQLRMTLIKGTGAAAIIGLPISACLMIYPERALHIMGEDFTPAATYLRAMAGAQIIVVLTGLCTAVLNMSGQERITSKINVTLLVLAAITIPTLCLGYGALGFVIAYCLTLLMKGIITATIALRMLAHSKLVWTPQNGK